MAKKITSTCAKAKKTTSEEWEEQKPVELIEGKTVYGISGEYQYHVSEAAENKRNMSVTCASVMSFKILSAKFDKENLKIVKDADGRDRQVLMMSDRETGQQRRVGRSLLFTNKKDAKKCVSRLIEYETEEMEMMLKSLAGIR